MPDRTRQQEKARFSWLSTAEFGERCGGITSESVCLMIADGWFGLTPDGIPECLNVGKVGAKRSEWRIHPSAVERFYRERRSPSK